MAKPKFERVLFNRGMWHEVNETEVKRVFRSNPLDLKQLMAGLETLSPVGSNVVYRIMPQRAKE